LTPNGLFGELVLIFLRHRVRQACQNKGKVSAMDTGKLLFLIVAGIITVAAVVKLWRIILGIAVIGGIAACILILQGGIDLPFNISNLQVGFTRSAPRVRYQPYQSNPRLMRPKMHHESKPDLVIISARQFPRGAILSKASPIYFELRVANRGSAPYGGTVLVQGWGGVRHDFQGLGPGESKSVRLPLAIRASGPGRTKIDNIFFRVDPYNVVAEVDESNNTIGPFAVTLY
jgi:hypothetical protein